MGLLLAPSGRAAVNAAGTPLVACAYPAWAEGTSYAAGDRVTYQGHAYQARQANVPPVGAGWTPVAVPALWQDLGACTGGTVPPSPSPSRTASPSPSASHPTSPSPSPTTSPPPGGSTCPVKSRPAGKVLQGYWENRSGARRPAST